MPVFETEGKALVLLRNSMVGRFGIFCCRIDLGKRHQEHVEDDVPPHFAGHLPVLEGDIRLVVQGEGQLVHMWLNAQQIWEGLIR